MPPNMPPEHESHGLAREKRDFDLRVIVATAIVTVLVAVIVHVGLRYLQLSYNREAERRDAPQPPTAALHGEPPGPALRPTPIQDLREFRRAQSAQLEGYAWMDDKHERVRIPITRAMELLAERGLPAPADSPSNASDSDPAGDSRTPGSTPPEAP